MIAAARSADPAAWALALDVLVMLSLNHPGEPRLEAPFIAALRDPSPGVREAAAFGWARVAGSRGRAALEAAAEAEPVSELRAQIVHLIGGLS